jgi:hypothetical protein
MIEPGAAEPPSFPVLKSFDMQRRGAGRKQRRRNWRFVGHLGGLSGADLCEMKDSLNYLGL